MRKVPAALAALAALTALLVTSTAGAITNGQPDGNGHPYVVALQLLGPNGGTLCSGTLVSPTVIVTAGHCTYGVTAPVRVWNSPRVGGPPVSMGRAYTSPDFSPTFPATVPNTGDLGVVRLEFGPPIVLSEYGELPAEGFLDSFSNQKGQQDLDVTIVGYGLQSLVGPAFERVTGKAQIRNVNSNNVRGYGLQTSNSRGNGTGGSGTCLGDSGGPILYGESNLLIGVNSWGQNANCVGNDFSYRTDTDAARAFLGQFVPLP